MNPAKPLTLDGLDAGVLLATAVKPQFLDRLPITPAYAFTYYHFQRQTTEYCIVDINTVQRICTTPYRETI